MSVINVASRLANISRYKYNPSAIQRDALLIAAQAVEGGVEFVDPTNPFILAMETTAVNTAAFMVENEVLNRRQYPIAALTPADLYLHMSDKDYLNRFAVPTTAVITMLIRKDELINSMVLDNTPGVYKITIPRNTFFTVADTIFSMQYPIDIRQQLHGGLQAVHDARVVSPLLSLTTNIVDMEERKDPSGISFMELQIPVTQFKITSRFVDVTAVSGFTTNVELTQEYHYARVFLQLTNGTWKEILTTHTDQIYDPNTPTVVLQVLPDKLQVKVPVIYTTTQQIRGKLRIDVYETKGNVNLLLKDYSPNDYSATFLAIDTIDKTPHVAALKNIRTFVMYSMSQTTGGRSGLTFEELRERVISHSIGPQVIPITSAQLSVTLLDKGYDVVRNIDTITNRVFQATKAMPAPSDDRLITAAAASINTSTLRFNKLRDAYGVIINSQGATLTPKALYKIENGITTIVPKDDYNSLISLTNAQKAEAFTASTYLYTPFHYVLDISEATFGARAYYLDNPTVLAKNFVAENASTGLQVSVDNTYSLERINAGYRLTISTRSNKAYRDLPDGNCFAQLSFKTPDQSVTAFLLGVQSTRLSEDNERIYVFDMATDFSIMSDHSLDQNSFTFSPTELTTRCALEQEFNICFIVNTPMPIGTSGTNIDQQLGFFQLPAGSVGVSWERLQMRFGHHLDALWVQSRTVLDATAYRTYDQDVLAYYKQDIYEYDSTGSFFELDADGELKYNILHLQGDQIFEPNGDPVYAHRAGDHILDNSDKPIPIVSGDDGLVRYVDLFLVEAAYRFATTNACITYREQLTSNVVNSIITDLAMITENLLDKSKIYYYPKVTQGNILVMALNGIEIKIPAGQAFKVTLHIPEATKYNIELLEDLKKTTVRLLDTQVKERNVSISNIIKLLLVQYSTDVINVSIEGLGGSANYDTLTVLEDAARLALRKRLVTQPDDQLVVEEDVTFNIIVHALKS